MPRVGTLDQIANKQSFVGKLKGVGLRLANLFRKNKLNAREARLNELMKNLEQAASRSYGSLSKQVTATAPKETAAEAAQSTQSEEKGDGEETDAEKKRDAETAKDGARMSVVGENSKTADLSDLETAIQRIERGVPASQVRKYLGRWQGKDGKWRYEISDKDMEFRREGFVQNPITLSDYLKHDELFRAYPSLRDITVKFDNIVAGRSTLNGAFNPMSNTIILKSGRTEAETQKTLLHEIQHVVQQIEGFARGSAKKEGGVMLFNVTYNQVKDHRDYKSLRTPGERMEYVIRAAEKIGGKSYDELSRDMYASAYGEVEARATADRMGMTETELREKQYFNDGVIFDDTNVKRQYIDNLIEIGYTKRKAKKIGEGGVPYGIQQENVEESSAQTGVANGLEKGKFSGDSVASNFSEESGRERAVYRRGEISDTDAVANNQSGANHQSGSYRVNNSKFSLSPETDAEYLSAVERGDTETARMSISPTFETEYDAWDKISKGGYFKLGSTSEALESVGINPADIYWDKSKIVKIKKEHPEMTDDVIKQIPSLLEYPVMIMQSQTVANRAVVFGEVYADDKPVLCALELKPNGQIDNFIKVASAYSKSGVQTLIDTSDILYLDPDKKRTDSWLSALRLQLPAGVTNYGSIGSITYTDRNVKGEIVFDSKTDTKSAIQEALEKAGYSQSMQNSETDAKKRSSLVVETETSSEPTYEELKRQLEKQKRCNAELPSKAC